MSALFTSKNSHTYILQDLVQAVMGVTIDSIPRNEQTKVLENCKNILTDYIIHYVGIKYGEKDKNRLIAVNLFNSPEVFETFPDLTAEVQEAYESFLDAVMLSWV